jgi:RES domain-containing protein
MKPELANAIAGQDPVTVTGSWQRHLPARFLATAMEGRQSYSRWGRDPGFPLLYFGRPSTSVIVEAYRHLVDPVDDPEILDHLTARVLVTADVEVSEILDLRTPKARVELGLSLAQIQSSTNDRASYAACQEVAAAAHQQGFHGLISPAATQLGDTLALFSDRLPEAEIPLKTGEVLWERLPADPRGGRASHLSVVKP